MAMGEGKDLKCVHAEFELNSMEWAKRLLFVSIRLLTIKRVSALNIRRYSISCSALVDMPWLVACSIGSGLFAHIARYACCSD